MGGGRGVGMGGKIHGREEEVSKSLNLHDTVSIYQVKLGSFWGHAGVNWNQLGSFWSHLGVFSESSWDYIGAISEPNSVPIMVPKIQVEYKILAIYIYISIDTCIYMYSNLLIYTAMI